jgi:hypothetical protein
MTQIFFVFAHGYNLIFDIDSLFILFHVHDPTLHILHGSVVNLIWWFLLLLHLSMGMHALGMI